jgi:hypothetical protein
MNWKLVLTRYIKANGRKGYEVDKVNRHVLESGLTFAEAKQRRNEMFVKTYRDLGVHPEVAIIAERGGQR